MQLAEKITSPQDLLKVDEIQSSAFFKECESLYGPLSEETFWKYREHLRSTYDYTKINIQGLPFHFVHFNKKDPNLIAFTSNENVGKKDGKTFIKPGKYLAQFTSLSNEQIKSVVTDYKHKFVPPELLFANSCEEVVKVYENGPPSCMMGKGWDSKEHPVNIYFGGPDIKLAFIKNKSGDGYSARTIVRVDKTPNEYITIYGDKNLMMKALAAKGIIPAKEGLRGARLPLMWSQDKKDKQLLMPYMDGNVKNAYISKDRETREHMTLGDLPTKDGTLYLQVSATPTAGYTIMPDVCKCSYCNSLEFKEDTVDLEGYSVCSKCVEGIETVIVNEGMDNLQFIRKRDTVLGNRNSYFEIENKWYSAAGLEEMQKWYDPYKKELVDLSGTAVEYSTGNRKLLKDLLILRTVDNAGIKYYTRGNMGNLLQRHINRKTFEFCTARYYNVLPTKEKKNWPSTEELCNEILAVFKAEHTGSDAESLKDKIRKKFENQSPAVHEFLDVYLRHFNGAQTIG